MNLPGGDVEVMSAIGYRAGEPLALVRLKVIEDDRLVELWMRPEAARKIGIDMIAAAHASVADLELRRIAKANGLDGDGLISDFRKATLEELP